MMTDEQIRGIINEEYEAYKNYWLQKTTKELWENSFRINAYECLYGFFITDEAELDDGVLQQLFTLSKGHILSELVEEYIYQEECNISVYSDIRWLIDEYIRYNLIVG